MDNIAIVGMGCLFPSYADKDTFWTKLINGERFVYEYNYQGTMVDRGGLVNPPANFFQGRLPDEEIRELDCYGDLFKWVAYVTDEALKQSGYASNREKLQRTGIIFGCLAQPIKEQSDAMYTYVEPSVDTEIHWVLGDDTFAFHREHRDMKIQSIFTDTEPARYISQKRGFGGPAIMFSAACATPLYAMKLAALYLNAGEADMIIAGSHCSNDTDEASCGLFETFGILCGAGQSRPLNKHSNGIVTGSGAGAFALKRLADAQRDGDHILAVIENIGLSNDAGTGSGILSPSTPGQLISYQTAYADGLSHDIDYIECHATGTEAGDESEVRSIEQFFNADRTDKIPIGALKGNTGHFLTATGCASIAKVVMALQENVIPATIAVDDPIYDAIVLKNTPWEPKPDKSPRRAGINAFGFGGVNAHLVLREHMDGEAEEKQRKLVRPEKELAIVGMGCNIGNFRSVEDFLEGLTTSTTAFETPSCARLRNYPMDPGYMDRIGLNEVPKGSYINDFEFDTMRFKMPVTSDPFFLRRDMLLLETAAEALDDAGIKQGAAPRTAVIINSALDFSDQTYYATSELRDSVVASMKQTCPEMTDAQIDEVVRIVREDEKTRETSDTSPGSITSIRANRISSHWGFSGPSFTIFEQEISIFRCIELAKFFIAEKLADQAVIGVVSLAGEIEHLYSQKEHGAMGLMRDQGIAEGAVVLVLKPVDEALADGDRIYAEVDGVALSSVSPDGVKNVETTMGEALARTAIGAHEIRTAEIPVSYDGQYSQLIEDVCRDECGNDLAPEFETQNVGDYVGFGFSLAAAASIVHQALQSYLSRSFDFGRAPIPWDPHPGRHMSLVTGYTYEKQFGCVVLCDVSSSPGNARGKLTSRLVMMPLRFSTPDDLRQRLLDLESASATSTFRKTYDSMWAGFTIGTTPELSNTAVLLCCSKESLRDEIHKLRRAIARFDDPGFVYTSSRGSYCALSLGDKTFDEMSVPCGTSQPGDAMGEFAKWFGLTPQALSFAEVNDITALYRPKRHLLALGAKLLSHAIPFDQELFLSRFDFYPLNRPSHVLQICNGLPAIYEHLSDPKNQVRLAVKGSESPQQLAMPSFRGGGAWENELAIIGMGLSVGVFDSIDSFVNALMTSHTAFAAETPSDQDYPASPEAVGGEVLTMAVADCGLPSSELRDAALVLLSPDSPDNTVHITQGVNLTHRCGIAGVECTVHGGDIVFFQGLALAQDLIREKVASVVCLCTAPVANQQGSDCLGEGAVVLVLKEKGRALEDQNKIYACVGAVAMAQRSSGDEHTCSDALSSALDGAGVDRNQVRVADVSCPQFAQGFGEGLSEKFGDYLDARFAVTDVERWLGRPLKISAAVSFVKQALQLSFCQVFVFDPSSSGPSINDQLAQTYWGEGGAQRASLIAYAPQVSGDTGFAVLTECIDACTTASPYPSNLALLPITCTGPDDLRTQLTQLRTSGASLGEDAMTTLWHNAWQDYRSQKAPAYTAVLAFTCQDALDEEISAMLAAVEGLSDGSRFVSGGRYESKLGSYFTADPYGADAKIVFMNPPYTLHNFLLFYQMIMMFPQYRHEYLNYLNSTYQQMLNDLDFHFGFSSVESGMIGIAQKFAHDLFGLSPDILIGASLGEITSLVAYNSMNWDNANPDSVYKLFSAFKDVFTFSAKDMTPMYCKGPLDEIRRIAAEHGDVYVSLIASPDGAFIAGTQEAVDKVITQGGFLAWRLSNDLAIHTPLVEHFYDEVYNAARDSGLTLRADKGFDIYSTYIKRPISDSQEDFCQYAASILIKECDFYGLLEVLYGKNARVFIDMGTGGSCYDWARDTFEGRDVTVFSVYPPVLDPVGHMFRIFAKLISNHVRFDSSAILSAFSHPFMKQIPRGHDAPGDENPVPTGGRLASSTVPAPVPGSAVSTFIGQALNNNVLAYSTYVDNEMHLLDWLARRDSGAVRRKSHTIWDRDQILEITGGSPSKVWGKRYEALDSLTVRARMPMPPFLFVDRVTGIDAEFGKFRPSWLETETDVTDDCILLTSDHMITPTLLAESSHSAILLMSYLGIDLISGGGVGYRILNSQGVYHNDIPMRGETVHSRLEFTDFINSGSMTLVKSKFWCYNSDDKLIVSFDLLGGLFTEQDLAANDSGSQQMPVMPQFTPLPEPYSNDKLYDGSQGPLFYPRRTSLEAEPVFVNPRIQMVDRIIAFDLNGGDYGLGLIVAEKDIDENHWSFKVHFMNDPVFPGTLLSEASSQIQFMYAMRAGYLKRDRKYYLLNNRNVVLKSSFRGEVKPEKSVIRFIQQFRQVTVTGNKVVILSDLDVYWKGKHVSRTENCCLDIEEIIR